MVMMFEIDNEQIDDANDDDDDDDDDVTTPVMASINSRVLRKANLFFNSFFP